MEIGHLALAIGILLFPGYLTLHLPFWGKANHIETKLGEGLFLSLLISVLVVGLLGLVLTQLSVFSLGSLLLTLAAYSLLCLALIAANAFDRRRSPDQGGVLMVHFDWAQYKRQAHHEGLSKGEKGSVFGELSRAVRRPSPLAGTRLSWEDAVVILLFCLSLLLYARPAEYILGWLDAGWYVNTGAHIAKTGSLTAESQVFSSLPASAKPMFYSSYALLKGMFPYFPDTESRGIYLWAFALADPDKGALTAYHPPLFSIWIAIFYAIGGIRFCLYATPFFGTLGVLSMYFAGKAMFGRKVGLLAAVLLAISFTQIYFSRMPYSEILSQCLLFGGIYALTTWTGFDRRRSLTEVGGARTSASSVEPSGDLRPSWELSQETFAHCHESVAKQSPALNYQQLHAVIAALCFGQSILCRIEGLIVILPLILFFGCSIILRRISLKHLISFALPYVVLLGDGVILALTSIRPYVELNSYGLWYKIRSLLSQSPVLLIASGILLGALLVLFAFLGLLHPLGGRSGGWLRRINEGRSLITTLLALAILLVAVYAYFIHPSPEGGNFAQLEQLLSPLGLWLGVIGLAELLRRDVNERTVFFLILMLTHGLATMSVLAISAAPLYLYSVRRQVPMLIPSLTLLASYAVLTWDKHILSVSKGKAPLLRIAQGIAIGILVISSLALDIPYLNDREMPDTIAFSERLASHFDEQDIVVFEETFIQDSRVGHFAAPLWAIYDKNALLMSMANVEEEAFAAALTEWLEAGKEVYFVSQSDPLPLRGYELTLVAEDKWRSSTTTILSAFPPKILEFEMPFYIYQIVEGEHL